MTAEQTEFQSRTIERQQARIKALEMACKRMLECLNGLEDLNCMQAAVSQMSALLPKSEDDHEIAVNKPQTVSRLVRWIYDKDRMKANLAFTAGHDRQIAYAVEDLLAGIGQ